MPKVHKRPDGETVFENYEFLEKILPTKLRLDGLPLNGWRFGIGDNNKEVIAYITVDLEQIWLEWWETKVPGWTLGIAKRIEEKTGNPVHIFLP